MPNKVEFNKCYWPDVREDVIKVNPELAAIIDNIAPDKSYPLFKASFPYGTEIIKRGEFYLPNERGEMVRLKDPSIRQEIKDLLGYNYFSNPACLCLKNTVEIFLPLEDRFVTFYPPIPAGTVFSTWIVLNYELCNHPTFLWYMTAGVRSIFMLPKISDAAFHKRLKKDYGILIDKPKTILDHWQVFKELARQPQFECDWSSDLLYFSKQWFDSLNDPCWYNFHRYLLNVAWKGSEFFRNKFIWDLIFSLIKQKKEIKVSAYIDNCVKHILSTVASGTTGLAPAEDDDIGPIKRIQEIYLESYRLSYPPIIMRPDLFSRNSKICLPVYTSLQVPTAQEFSLKPSRESTTIGDLYEVKSLFTKYIDVITNGSFCVEHTPYYNALIEAEIDFFHSQPENYLEIRNSRDIPKEDQRFTNGFKSNKFPVKSTFLQGCIRVSKKS